MTGKELILKAFRLEEVERIPWVPFVGIHEAKLIDVPGDKYLQSAELISRGAAKAIRKDHPDIALYGLITGPFTLALHLLGSDIFIKMFED
jgi:hypothetical protein